MFCFFLEGTCSIVPPWPKRANTSEAVCDGLIGYALFVCLIAAIDFWGCAFYLIGYPIADIESGFGNTTCSYSLALSF